MMTNAGAEPSCFNAPIAYRDALRKGWHWGSTSSPEATEWIAAPSGKSCWHCWMTNATTIEAQKLQCVPPWSFHVFETQRMGPNLVTTQVGRASDSWLNPCAPFALKTLPGDQSRNCDPS